MANAGPISTIIEWPLDLVDGFEGYPQLVRGYGSAHGSTGMVKAGIDI